MNAQTTYTCSTTTNLTGSGFSLKQNDNNTMFTSPAQAGDIFYMAKAFLGIEAMTHKKLQKLCYYAKAWYLALYDENIINRQFQAWVHGAVQPELYQKYRKYGFEIIPKIEDMEGVPEEYISFSQEIYEAYGHLTGDQLEEINHKEDPWIKARGSCKPWEKCNNTILESDMKQFYRAMING